MSPAELALNCLQADEIKAKNWIYSSCSPYGAPILFFFYKKKKYMRVSIDFCELNKSTKRDRYSIPRIDDLLDHLLIAKIYSKIDLAYT